MRVLLQRVNGAAVTVAGQTVGKIGRGLLLFVAIAPTDTDVQLDWMVRKCLDLRLFPHPDATESKWDCSVQDLPGEILIVSQFTLYGDCRKGRRPSFSGSAPPQQAREQYDQFVDQFQRSGLTIATGEFGANMQVHIDNDGPVTLWLEREAIAES